MRAGQYSQFVWDYKCFSGIDHIENPTEDGVFKIVNDYTGEGWNEQVDDELGNFDYLMGANIDFRNRTVTEDQILGALGNGADRLRRFSS